MTVPYPLTEAFLEELRARNFTLFLGDIERLEREFGEEFRRLAEKVLGFSSRMGGTPCDSLITFTMKYLREQIAYLSTGKYSNDDFDAVYAKVYNNPEVMKRFYLEGLMLSYAFWYIPFLTQRFFAVRFLPRVVAGSYGCEFGFGHGLYLLQVLESAAATRTRSCDISPYAVEYASRVFELAGIDGDRYTLELGDVRQRFPFHDGELAWAVMAEVIEHLEDPRHALGEMARCLGDSGIAFVSTVVDSNHLDHIYAFESAGEIRDMVAAAGLEVEEGVEYRASDMIEGSKDISNRVSLIVRRR